MRKHFLLFLLTVLLPLAGWAVNLNDCLIEVGNVNYGGTTAPTIYIQYEGDRLYMGADKDYTWDTHYYAENTCETDEGTDVSVLAVGPHYIKVVGVSPFEGTVAVAFQVNKAPLTVTFNGAANFGGKAFVYKTYGDANPVLTKTDFDFAGWVGTENTGTDEEKATARALVTSVIDYTYSQAQANANADTGYDLLAEAANYPLAFKTQNVGNYEITFAPVGMRIAQKDLSAEALTITPYADQTYKGGVYTPTYTVKLGTTDIKTFTVATFSDDLRTTPADAINVGTYYVRLTFSGNYAGTNDDQDFDINKAPMSVQIGNVEKPYKGAAYAIGDLTPTLTYLGFVGNDVGSVSPAGLVAPTLALADGAKDVNDAGYAITATANGSSTNYELTVITNGKLTITPAPLTITADNKSSKVGEALKALTYTLGGLQPGDDKAAAIATEPTLTKADGNTVGTYDITVTGGTAKANYTIKNRVKGTYTIDAGALTVTVLNNDKFYGDADPDELAAPVAGEDYIVTGAVTEDAVKVTALTYTGTNAGNYSLTPVYTYDEDNYDGVTVVPGNFEIKKRVIAVELATQTLNKGDKKDALSLDFAKVTGQKDGDKIKDLIALDFNNDGGDAVPVDGTGKLTDAGTYAKGIVFAVIDANYTAVATTGKLIVVDPASTIVLNRPSKAMWTANNDLDDAADVIDDNKGEDRVVTFGDFAMKAEKWYPIVLPFATSVKEVSETFGYAVVNILNESNTDDSKIAFKLHMGNIDANVPFVVKVYEDTNMNSVAFGDPTDVTTYKTIVKSAAPEVKDASGVKFIGSYSAKTDGFKDNEAYFSVAADKNQYYWGSATNQTYMAPLAAYFQIPAGSAARIIEFEEADGTVTAIEVVKAEVNDGNAVKNVQEGWYTINGVKLNAAPTQKGIYINNGKKVVIK